MPFSGYNHEFRKKKLTCHLHHKDARMEDLTLPAKVRRLDPYMISWSNVPHYLVKSAFIRFAQGLLNRAQNALRHFHQLD